MEVPAFAAVATSVELAGANKASRPFKGLVNAVLRGLLRDGGLSVVAGFLVFGFTVISGLVRKPATA